MLICRSRDWYIHTAVTIQSVMAVGSGRQACEQLQAQGSFTKKQVYDKRDKLSNWGGLKVK